MKKYILAIALFISACLPAYADSTAKMGEDWQKISIYDVKNPAVLFGEDWAALASGNKDSLNAMTIGWGQFGMLWGVLLLRFMWHRKDIPMNLCRKMNILRLSVFLKLKKKL